jgi:hypothetical protein
MRGRIRIAAVGLAAVAMAFALSASAGAATTPGSWNLKADGGFVSLSLLNKVQVSGGGSEADAASSNLAEALGTGACVSGAATSNPCPTTPGSVGSFALDTSQFAVQKGLSGAASPSPAGSSNCAVPAVNAAPLLSLGPACGSATASEDANGNPTAEGTGSLVGAQALTLSLNSLLSSGIGGLSLPSASELCSGIPAATATAGSGTSSLPAPVNTVLTSANGLLSGITNGTALAPTSIDSNSPLDGVCSIVGGVVNELGSSPAAALLTDLTSAAGTSGLPPLLSITAGGSDSKVATAANGGTLTATATQEAVDLNVLGMLDIQVTPTTSSVSVNTATGQVTPTCNAGVVSVTAAGQALPLSQLNALGSTIQDVLTQLGATPLGTVIDQLLNFHPGGVLSCTPGTTAGGTSGTATADSVDLNLAPAVNLLSLDLGNVDAAATTSTAPTVASSPSVTPSATPAGPAPTPAVPNVTSVHTGEYWAGPLPIVLLAGMGLAGLALIGRRRIASAARSLHPISRLRGGQ